MKLWCLAVLAISLLAACSDGAATPDLPIPDAGADAPPGPPDAMPEDPNAIGRACDRSGGDAKGDCPANHLCVGADGAAWCTLKCDGVERICSEAFDGTGTPTCSLSLDPAAGDQMLVCAARSENKLGAACAVSATSSQGDCPTGHMCLAAAGATTGTCTFKCADDTACTTGFAGQGEATCSNQISQPNGNAAPVTVTVCAVRAVSALGRACTRAGGSSQGDCPDGHTCVVNGAAAQGWCSFACDVAADTCADGYQGAGDPFCSYAFIDEAPMPICAIACMAGPDRACRTGRCDGSCPTGTACAFPLEDFGPAGDQFPPEEYGVGCI
jgi:hypothetical protein